ncbi:multiple C2 and transmembrane domain-containing protein-like isoform X1 [Vanessa cardui]|uniref:multiple C2 and transmembrane domain-containing protein-like isoform X1 n=1 Tax=Vanessa cardui TaxID=171605 RepID=UPI001F132261|nr:multiple C2 and transmembrane domain-containing protein-like isoform X1 [Vanessa cardui]
MENERKTERLTKKHIAKLHDKIQYKYEEMQRKLEKSKSIDFLTNLNDDYKFQCQKKFVSVSDLSNVDQVHKFDNSVSVNRSIVYVETNVLQDKQKDATFEEILYKEATITESDSMTNICDRIECESENEVENEFFNKELFKTSLESLNEVSRESDESSELTPPPRSIRDRIESRLKKRHNDDKEKKSKNKRKESHEKVDKYILSNTSKHRMIKLLKKNKIATVSIALIEVTGLEEVVDEKARVLSFKFRLGAEKRKCKLVKSVGTKVKFQELFNLSMFDDDNILEISLWDKDTFMGRCILDLSQLEKERTHKMFLNLEGDFKNIQVFFLLTISGTTFGNTLYDVDENEIENEKKIMRNKYIWYRFYDQFKNIGILTVVVYGAKGLSGHDCYCVVHLNNERIQTQTDYKTNDPSWMKIMNIMVTDITSILEVSVFDEKKTEEIGKISIPLLSITPGKKWYALKDSTLKEKAKGNNARILLEMNIIWNFIKAAARVINPKETNYLLTEEKLDRHLFARNLSRAKVVSAWIVHAFNVMKTCFAWESRKANTIALLIWIPFCLYAKMWMLPLLLLIPFIYYKPDGQEKTGLQVYSKHDKDDKNVSLRQKINSLQEILISIQNIIGKFASTGESIKNLFNFTVPFVSVLAIFFIILITFVMYLIPFNYICIIWGINKFTKKILMPNRIPHNEMLDLLSRVPDDVTLMECEELPLGDISEDDY